MTTTSLTRRELKVPPTGTPSPRGGREGVPGRRPPAPGGATGRAIARGEGRVICLDDFPVLRRGGPVVD